MEKPHSMNVSDIVALMAGMSANRIGGLEFNGLKLVSKADDRNPGSAVSSYPVKEGPAPTMPPHVGFVPERVVDPRLAALKKKQEAEAKKEGRKVRLPRGPLSAAVTKLVEASKEPPPPTFKPLTVED